MEPEERVSIFNNDRYLWKLFRKINQLERSEKQLLFRGCFGCFLFVGYVIMIAFINMVVVYPAMDAHYSNIIREIRKDMELMVKPDDLSIIQNQLIRVENKMDTKMVDAIAGMESSLKYTQHLQDCVAQGQHWYDDNFAHCIADSINK